MNKRKKRKLKKWAKIGIFVFLIIIFLSGGYLMKDRLFSSLLNFNSLDIEINSNKMLYDLIKFDDNLVFITNDYKIDTSKLGKQELKIEVEKDNKRQEVSFTINIIDTEKPIIDGVKEIIVSTGSKVDLLNGISATDNSLEKLDVLIKGDYNLDKKGEYNLEYYVSDSSGNVAKKKFVLKVIDLNSAPVSYTEYQKIKDGDYSTNKGYTLSIKDGVAYVDGYVIVNKTYALPSDYRPIDPYSGYANVDSCINCIDKQTMKAFNEMEADASSIGLNIYISSGYRSYNRQKTLYNNYSVRDGKDAADKYSARPGHSEHQTGFCFDLNTIDDSFAYTDEGKWVNENAYLYGFIIRYPKGKEDVTGYQYESWHLRYVGVDLAKKLYNNSNWITIEEYFGLTSKYN